MLTFGSPSLSSIVPVAVSLPVELRVRGSRSDVTVNVYATADSSSVDRRGYTDRLRVTPDLNSSVVTAQTISVATTVDRV